MAGEIVTPVPAASVLVLRDDPFEVLLLRRSEKSSFMPGAWVFPGGIAEARDATQSDGSTLGTMRITAARETLEECGITVDPNQLVWTSRWITPAGVPKRFDTFFFLAKVSRDVVATADGVEMVDAKWIAPREALSMQLMFPTRGNLQAIAEYASVDALLDARRNAIIETTQPILVNGKPTLPEK